MPAPPKVIAAATAAGLISRPFAGRGRLAVGCARIQEAVAIAVSNGSLRQGREDGLAIHVQDTPCVALTPKTRVSFAVTARFDSEEKHETGRPGHVGETPDNGLNAHQHNWITLRVASSMGSTALGTRGRAFLAAAPAFLSYLTAPIRAHVRQALQRLPLGRDERAAFPEWLSEPRHRVRR